MSFSTFPRQLPTNDEEFASCGESTLTRVIEAISPVVLASGEPGGVVTSFLMLSDFDWGLLKKVGEEHLPRRGV